MFVFSFRFKFKSTFITSFNFKCSFSTKAIAIRKTCQVRLKVKYPFGSRLVIPIHKFIREQPGPHEDVVHLNPIPIRIGKNTFAVRTRMCYSEC